MRRGSWRTCRKLEKELCHSALRRTGSEATEIDEDCLRNLADETGAARQPQSSSVQADLSIEGTGVGASLSGRRRLPEGERATECGGRVGAGPCDLMLRSEVRLSDCNLPAVDRGVDGAGPGAKLGMSPKIDKRRKPATLPPCPLVFFDEVGTAYAAEVTKELAVRGRGGCGVSVATLAARDLPADPVTNHEAEPRSRGTGNEALSEARAGM